MRAAAELLQDLRARQVQVRRAGADLDIVIAEGDLDAAIISKVSELKLQILALLRGEELRLPARIWGAPSPAIALREQLGWSSRRFHHLCERLLGRPGPATIDEDLRVVHALLEQTPGHRSPPTRRESRAATPSTPDYHPPTLSPQVREVLALAQSDVSPEELFDLIDSVLGYRTIGPFSLTANEANTIIAAIRERFEEGPS